MADRSLLKAMVVNLFDGRDPLYRLRHWAENVPLDLLLGPDVIPEHLNDTSLARHLDRFFEAGPEQTFNQASLRAIDAEGLSVERVHNDTTSRLVFGNYAHPADPNAISITWGHSKDQLKAHAVYFRNLSEAPPIPLEQASVKTKSGHLPAPRAWKSSGGVDSHASHRSSCIVQEFGCRC